MSKREIKAAVVRGVVEALPHADNRCILVLMGVPPRSEVRQALRCRGEIGHARGESGTEGANEADAVDG